jgi:hypothetical protein
MDGYIGQIRSRGELLDLTDYVNLTAVFRDQFGNFVNTDTFPKISIIQPSGTVLFAPTSVGVLNPSTGNYSYVFQIPLGGPFGVFNDIWSATINGQSVMATFTFIASHGDLPGINNDGYIQLGDDYPLNYSQRAIHNINKLLRMLKARLNSDGKTPRVINGNTVYIDCSIYSVDTLTTFLGQALSDFNQVPYFTHYTFEDENFVGQFGDILVEGATGYALLSKALTERGAEYSITDQSINFNLPTVSEMLKSQADTLLANYWDKLKYIKNSLRPGPAGMGTFTSTSGGSSPALNRLRFRRAGRIY